ncbi:MAG: hypothetical protein RsTaC01_0658 [Candidatus Paraimprobicoccus trichonymphae]|uniref:MORN repeat protein n=1 Tax=Candidatus Paraimprobicoccus trichonymphae TaxID=3033793 RepID=A0AA48HWL2_9FIRM|nr:MAG: hypothetical protein RsTaC01_0658 [Candidatus Paraimprobicoccus trichonymphae]
MWLGDVFSRLTSNLQMQMQSMSKWISKITNFFTRINQIIQQSVQSFLQTLSRKPNSKKDYIRIFGMYFSKKFVVTFVLITCSVIFTFVYVIYPWADGRLWCSNIKLDTAKYSTFTGKAKVKDAMGVTVFVGTLQNGNPEGFGTQYDLKGNLLYAGLFSAGKYTGLGEYYSEKKRIYNGNFENNSYNGEGELFNSEGKLIYTGNFDSGQKSGKGIEFNPETKLRTYYGEFVNDLREGRGILYDKDGRSILYKGDFKSGVYEGIGNLYSNGVLIYSGEFKSDLFEGKGDKYNPKSAKPEYTGEFKAGVPEGVGQLYNQNNFKIAYEGEFLNGKKHGAGILYNILGTKMYEGDFKFDTIDYFLYLNSDQEKILESFGKETYKIEEDDKLIVSYLNLKVSVVFYLDPEKEEYSCQKIIVNPENFMGLSAESTLEDRGSLLGKTFSSAKYDLPDYYKTIFSHININVNSMNEVIGEKYNLEKYFIRFYFNSDGKKTEFVELGTI